MIEQMNPNGFFLMSNQHQVRLEQRLREAGWHVIVLPGPRSRESFFQVSRVLPSDPLIGPHPNWDGFADSLSGGLIDFANPLVAIVWHDAHLLKKADPPSFILAIEVFEQVAANQWLEQKRGHTKNRVLFFVLGNGPLFDGKLSPEEIGL